jgi:hypothetical protein
MPLLPPQQSRELVQLAARVGFSKSDFLLEKPDFFSVGNPSDVD